MKQTKLKLKRNLPAQSQQQKHHNERKIRYIPNWIIEYTDIYSYGIIYSCTVNVNLMLIYIELLALIIYCKYA